MRRTEKRIGREIKEKIAMEEALLAWLEKQSGENAHRLYVAGCSYFGIKPVLPD